MSRSTTTNNSGKNHNISTTIYADLNWVRKEKKKTILILIVAGILVFVLSVIYQDIYFALIRGFIFSIACFIIYFKSDSILSYRIQFYRDGKIIIKKGLLKSLVSTPNPQNIHLNKKNKNWLIGEKNVKLPIDAFPNLDNKIKEII